MERYGEEDWLESLREVGYPQEKVERAGKMMVGIGREKGRPADVPHI